MWGIGSRYADKLRSFGINNAWELAHVTDAFAKKHLTVVGLRLVRELRGEPCADLEIEPPAKKNICSSRSFGKTVNSMQDLGEAVAAYAAKCAYKLRQQKSNCSVISVFIHTNHFKEQDEQYYNAKTIYLPVPTNLTMELVKAALEALQSIYRESYNYKKAGVYVSEISPSNNTQLALFDKVDRGKHTNLMVTLDTINKKLGRGSVKLAAEGINHTWEPKAEKVSPCYTTRINDVMRVR